LAWIAQSISMSIIRELSIYSTRHPAFGHYSQLCMMLTLLSHLTAQSTTWQQDLTRLACRYGGHTTQWIGASIILSPIQYSHLTFALMHLVGHMARYRNPSARTQAIKPKARSIGVTLFAT